MSLVSAPAMDESMDNRRLVKVKCAWPSNVDGMDIENCVVVRFQPPEHETTETDVVLGLIEDQNCNCVNFAKHDENDDFFVNISCDPRNVIKRIVVNSEAKILELFGKTGEYISTHPATSCEYSYEFPMNVHDVHVNSTECSIKFSQLKNSDFIWIYSVLIYLAKTKDNSNTSIGPINMQNVQRLTNPTSLPTNASKLLSALSQKQSKSLTNNILDSILTLRSNTEFEDNINCNRLINTSLQQFGKGIDDKLDIMGQKLNTIVNQINTLDKKFNTLLDALHQEHNIVTDLDKIQLSM